MLWHNGEFKDDNEALLTASDRLRYGDGVFDTALFTTKIIHAQRHYNRLKHDAGIMGINVPVSFEEWKKVACEMAPPARIELQAFALNTLISRGTASGALGLPGKAEPQIIMRPRPVSLEYPPVEAIISSIRRNEGSPLSQIKSCNYGDEILALSEAQDKGGNEAIMLNNAGNVVCASTSNIFTVIDGELITPPLSDGAMAGVIRSLLIERMSAKEKSLSPDNLRGGFYVTNSVAGVRAVQSLDGETLPAPAITIDKDFHLS